MSAAYTRWTGAEEEDEGLEDSIRFMGSPSAHSCCSKKRRTIIKVLGILILFVAGVLIGYGIRRHTHDTTQASSSTCSEEAYSWPHTQDYDPALVKRMCDSEASRKPIIEAYLKKYGAVAVVPGTKLSLAKATELEEAWVLHWDHQHVKHYAYNVYISSAESCPGADSGTSVLVLNGKNETAHSSVNTVYCPYSASDTKQGAPVYANLGRSQDFLELKDAGITLKGAVAIMRYGEIPPGVKVENAGRAGAVAAVLYSEPHAWGSPDLFMPHTRYLNDSAVTQLHVRPGDAVGDIMTPRSPALENSKPHVHPPKTTDNGDNILAKIPVVAVSYGDADFLLNNMAGPDAPAEWKGAIDVTYKLGPGYAGNRSERTVRVKACMKNTFNLIKNVIGTIRGGEEPDRYVIVGCHRDSLSPSATDMASGLTLLSVIFRQLGDLVNENEWRPRRSIMFAAWDAKELGMIGSYEWIQQYEAELMGRAVAYIDLDSVVAGGEIFWGEASPLLQYLLANVTDQVDSPLSHPSLSPPSLLHDWVARDPEPGLENFPRIPIPKRGSDIDGFLFLAGIPSLRFGFAFDDQQHQTVQHTQYDSVDYLTTFVDPDTKLHITAMKVAIRLITRLSDSARLPLNVTGISRVMRDGLHQLRKDFTQAIEQDFKQQFDHLEQEIERFKKAADFFQELIDANERKDPFQDRQFNDRLMQLSRIFIDPDGDFSRRPAYKNVLLAPNAHFLDQYRVFPELTDALVSLTPGAPSKDNVEDAVARTCAAVRRARVFLDEGLVR